VLVDDCQLVVAAGRRQLQVFDNATCTSLYLSWRLSGSIFAAFTDREPGPDYLGTGACQYCL